MNNDNYTSNDESIRRIRIKMREYNRSNRATIRSLMNSLAKEIERRELAEEENAYYKAVIFSPKSEKRSPKSERPYSQGSLIEVFQESSQVAEKDCKMQEADSCVNEDASSEAASSKTSSSDDASSDKVVTYVRKKRQPRARKNNDSLLDLSKKVVRIEHEPEDVDADHICSCGSQMVVKSEEEITKIEYIPAHLEIHVYHKRTYMCPNCEGDEEACKPILPSELDNEVLPEAYATNSLLSQILFNKYACALPLYRQTMIFDELGAHLQRPTMVRWINKTCEYLKPLYEEILSQIQQGETINMDETRLQVLQESGRSNQAKSQLWQMAGGRDGPCRFFHYDTSRSARVVSDLLGPFKGFLQTDGYAGYVAIGNREGITHVGCLDHIRRKFRDVIKCTKKGTMPKTESLAQQILDEIGQIYMIERSFRDKDLPPDEFLAQRKELAEPILSKLFATIESAMHITPRKSLLGRALTYAFGQWHFLQNYLLHPGLGPSNQLSENAIRPVVVGRKNYLFSGSPRGAENLAIIYTLIETAKANGLSALKYIRYLLDHVRTTAASEIASLLPWNCSLEA